MTAGRLILIAAGCAALAGAAAAAWVLGVPVIATLLEDG